jgi:hypothetical protein
VSRVTAATGQAPLIGSRSGKLQEFGERRGSGVMHGRAYRHLDGFQIQAAGLAPSGEDDA